MLLPHKLVLLEMALLPKQIEKRVATSMALPILSVIKQSHNLLVTTCTNTADFGVVNGILSQWAIGL